MSTPPRFPDRISGPQRTDRLLSTLSPIAALYVRLARRSARGRPPVAEVNRDLPMVVERISSVADGVKALVLRASDGSLLPAWRPGAHLDLVLPSGRVRQYSLCGDPGDLSVYRIAVRLLPDGGGGSVEAHGLSAGMTVVVRGPRNAFPFVSAPSYLFIAGGIGITPILPMVRMAAAAGADWRLVYTGRSLASMPFLDELSAVDSSRVWLRPDSEYGIPASGAELLERAPAGAHVYCCGPMPMITGVRTDLPDGQVVHFERFGEPPIVGGRVFRVRLARSGVEVEVPADRSALEVIRSVKPDVAYSCRQGFCGTCRIRVLDGEVEQQDGGMRVCVARGRGVVTLDY